MALMFQRLARNFIKNGYYPTDSETMGRIIQALYFCGRQCHILDPWCGEGTALAEIKHSLGGSDLPTTNIQSFGVEYDQERAWHSKQILDHCIHGDIRDCMIGARQFGLLFLNPPYGDAVSDQAQLSDAKNGRLRLEKEFYRRTHGLLQPDGIMVLIIPYYVLDAEFSSWISNHFHDVSVYMAPEQQFKQCVIFGVKHKVTNQWPYTDECKATQHRLVSVGNGDIAADELPEFWDQQTFNRTGDGLYHVPALKEAGRFELVRLDPAQLADTLKPNTGLWKQYDQLFSAAGKLDHRRPLCDVSNWHLALMLAAGQVSGVVNSQDGRTFVVRGNTYKDKRVTTTHEPGDKGKTVTVRTHLDIFVPAIRGLDMTPGSTTFGEVFTIR